MDGRRKIAVMLRGHESLLRLVGKRRKLHPSVFSFPACEEDGGPLVCEPTAAENGEGSRLTDAEIGKENCPVEWVSCPVCSKSINGNVINNHLDTCLAQQETKGSRRKSTQLTLFSSMKRITKTSTTDASRKDKAQAGKRTSEISNVVGIPTLPTSHLSQFKVSSLSAKDDSDDFQEDVPTALNSLNGHPDANVVSTVMPLAGADATGVGSCSDEMVSDDSNEGVLCPFNDKRTVKQEFTKDVVKPEISECRNPTSQIHDVKDRSDSITDMKVEPLELTQTDYVKFEELCICTCHFVPVNSCSSETPESIHSASSRDNLDVIDSEGSVHMDDVVRDVTNRDSSVVVGTIDTHIVGRKFSMEAVCEEGMPLAFVRDPDNPKDSNAIKVITPDKLELGYLPRQVASHFSVILDKELGDLKGVILAVPEDVFEIVPIKVTLEMKNLESEHEEIISKCWQGALSASLIPPKQFKYEANFLCLLQTVLERDSHLFNSDEQVFLCSFQLLSGDAQRLFIHLYQRKGPWFRVKNLNYSDVADVESSFQELIAARFMIAAEAVADGSATEFREIVEVLNVFDLRQLVSSAQLKDRKEVAGARKEELVDWVTSGVLVKDQVSALGSCSGTVVKEMVLDLVGSCIRVSDDASFLLWRSQRLFFLNGDQDLSSFLLVDMGRVKYPEYKCNRKLPVFATREALLEYEKALEVAQAMDMALEVNDMTAVMAFLTRARTFLRIDQNEGSKEPRRDGCPSFFYRFTAARVYATVCTLGVSILEREHRYGEAIELLKELLSTCIRSGRRGYWTVRLSMDLDHLGRKEESLQVAEKGVTDPLIRGGDLVALQRRVVRLSKPPRRWKKPPYAEALNLKFEEVQIRGRPLNCTIGMKSRFYGFDEQQCGVEELALQYYASEEGGGWEGMHSEGGVWMMLFGLLMWEVLFADVPDVFQTPFQTAPLDLDSHSFFIARRDIIEARLEEIRQGQAVVLLAECWSKHYGTYCRGVNWEKYSLDTLQIIAACVGGSGLSALCRLLTQDHAGYSAGMPDLLLWRTYREPSLLRRSSSDINCLRCDCGQEMDSLEPAKSAGPVEAEGIVNVTKGCVLRGEAKLVEVKGPRDRLSEQQRAWIASLLSAGLAVQVCKVLESIDN
ncbi:hypothetical protein M758_5G178400 [Ceratodon purpureus]|nr:hypothetical protein M758_5G178400 [Ceratodon purpureus]